MADEKPKSIDDLLEESRRAIDARIDANLSAFKAGEYSKVVLPKPVPAYVELGRSIYSGLRGGLRSVFGYLNSMTRRRYEPSGHQSFPSVYPTDAGISFKDDSAQAPVPEVEIPVEVEKHDNASEPAPSNPTDNKAPETSAAISDPLVEFVKSGSMFPLGNDGSEDSRIIGGMFASQLDEE